MRSQLICQNFILALSRRSSRTHTKFSVRASTTANFPWLLSSLLAQKSPLQGIYSAKGVNKLINAVPPLFTACAASRLLTKSYPVTGITRENLRPEYPVSALRLGSYLPHSCLEAAFQRIHAAALSGKGKCVLLFVIAFWIWLITNKKYSTEIPTLSRKSCFPA